MIALADAISTRLQKQDTGLTTLLLDDNEFSDNSAKVALRRHS